MSDQEAKIINQSKITKDQSADDAALRKSMLRILDYLGVTIDPNADLPTLISKFDEHTQHAWRE